MLPCLKASLEARRKYSVMAWHILGFTAKNAGGLCDLHLMCGSRGFFLYGHWAETTQVIPYRSQGDLWGLAVLGRHLVVTGVRNRVQGEGSLYAAACALGS